MCRWLAYCGPSLRLSEHWELEPESSLLVVEDGTTTVSSFSPE